MLEDGIYCDAKWMDGRATIAVVQIVQGNVQDVQTKVIDVLSNHEAECAAIAFARDLYAEAEILNDNSSACRDCNAVWIPRSENREAHRACEKAWRNEGFGPSKLSKKKKRKLGVGRGILCAGEISRFVLWDRGD